MIAARDENRLHSNVACLTAIPAVAGDRYLVRLLSLRKSV